MMRMIPVHAMTGKRNIFILMVPIKIPKEEISSYGIWAIENIPEDSEEIASEVAAIVATGNAEIRVRGFTKKLAEIL
ncbi:MAG TPA: hypothetical protein ENG34_00165 [Candidatus Aenigmarchaeota archaeon]|nr:hypothetical protein [Candidatus Aenigmarchaeota archaeon]